MVKVCAGSSIKHSIFIVDDNTTLRTVFKNAGITPDVKFPRRFNALNGSVINDNDLDKSFAQFGITKECYLISMPIAYAAEDLIKLEGVRND